MNYRVFQYPLPAPPALDDLNAHLASRRIAAVAHHVVQTATGPMLLFIVEGVESGPAPTPGGLSSKIDYREALDPEQFAVFSRLRAQRKQWAEAEGVPVYTVFTNAQLAEMVRRQVRTLADLADVNGVGPARVEKYGPRIVEIMAEASRPPGEEPPP